MRALIAAATGFVLAFALVVLAVTATGSATGSTSPKPLLTTVPPHP
ncbi:SPW_0924 family protein [Streptomyces sp. NPDC054834]